MTATRVNVRTRRHPELPGVLQVEVGSGGRANALRSADWQALADTFVALAEDPELAAVVLHGSGGTFSAGSDVGEWVRAEPEDVADSFAKMEAACTAIEELPAPVVAAVHGVAAGAGCQLALACDLQVLSASARLGMPVARFGILVSAAFAARIGALAGPGVARELLYTGRLVGADEAVRLGLATRCVPAAELDQQVTALLRSIVGHPRPAIRAAKRAVSAGLGPQRAATRAETGGPAVAYDQFRRQVRRFLDGD